MKKLFTVLVFIIPIVLAGQSVTPPQERKSPLIHHVDSVGDLLVRLQYGSPAVRGRELWGQLVPFDQVWRTGANEASTIELSDDVMVHGEHLQAGKYAIFTIPTAEEWTVIFNTIHDQWGAYDYNPANDALRVVTNPVRENKHSERMVIEINSSGIQLCWGDLILPIQIQMKEKQK